MDRHVQERAAAGEQELQRRRIGVPGVGAELLDSAELAGIDEHLGALVARVEAAHEPDLDRPAGLAPEVDDPGRLSEVLGDRLLGPHRLAGQQRGLDQRGVRRRRRHDHHGVDGGVADGLVRVGARPLRRAPGRDHRIAARSSGSATTTTLDVGDGREVTCVRLSHPAGAEEGDPDVVGILHRETSHRVCSILSSLRGTVAFNPTNRWPWVPPGSSS